METRVEIEARLRRANRMYGDGYDLTTLRLSDPLPGFFEPSWHCDARQEPLRSVRFSIGAEGALVLDHVRSTRDSRIEVAEVPACVTAAEVRRALSGLALWPWPRSINWASIADVPAGRLIRRHDPASYGWEYD